MRRRAKRLLFVFGSIIGILIFIGMIIWFAWPTIRGVYWNNKNKAYIEENKTAEMNQIVFLGDSLTDGYNLSAYFSSDLEIYNRGIGGDKTDGVLARLESNVLGIEPSVIILLIGINDIHGGRSLETVEKNYRQILDMIQEELPECEVYIESLYPTNTMIYSHFTDYWDDIISFNSTLQSIATEYGYVYMDVYSELLSGEELNRDFSFDGLHLNGAGYLVVSEIIASHVSQLTIENEADGS